MSNLLQKASIVTTPTAYGVGVLNSIKPAQSFSEELVTNGNFATDSNWIKGGEATISGGVCRILSTSGSFSGIYQTVLVVGKTYILTFDVTNVVSGNLKVGTLAEGASDITSTVNSLGTKSFTFTATGTVISFARTSGQTDISIDNVSVVEVTDADFQFSRTSSATRVNPDYLIETVSINSANLVQNGNFSELGSQELTNGNFSNGLTNWTLLGTHNSDNYAIVENGRLILRNDGTGSGVYQTVLTTGKTYKITLDVSEIVGNGFKIDGLGVIVVNTVGTKTFYAKATESNFYLYRNSVSPQAINGATIDNVSVKQVDPNDNWSLGTSWSFGEDKAIYTTGSSTGIQQDIGLIGNRKYKITINNSGSGINLYLGSNTSAISVPNGLYEQTLTTASNTNGILYISNFAGGLTGYITNISVIEIQENGVPRLDYTNGTASILLEPQSSNLITYSNDFTNAAWSKTNAIITANQTISPEGIQNADKYSGTTIGQNFSISISVSDNFSYFLYVKYINAPFIRLRVDNISTWFNIETIQVGTNGFADASIEDAGNGWRKITVINTTSGSFNNAYIHPHATDNTTNEQDGGEFFLYGAQLEALSYATSYIPTSGSTVTRAAETLNNAANSDLINSTEGVLYAEIKALSEDGGNRYISLSDGTDSNRIILRFQDTDKVGCYVRSTSGSDADITKTSASISSNFLKVAVKWKTNDVALWVNGVEVGVDSSFTTFNANVLDKLNLTGATTTTSQYFYGKVKTVAVFKEALSDTELACLTSTNNREIFLNYYYRMQYVGANTEALSCAEQTFNV